MHAAHDHLSVRDYGASHGSHDHDHFQILIGLGGVLELEVAGRGQRISAGQGCVVPPGERHEHHADLAGRRDHRSTVFRRQARIDVHLRQPQKRRLQLHRQPHLKRQLLLRLRLYLLQFLVVIS